MGDFSCFPDNYFRHDDSSTSISVNITIEESEICATHESSLQRVNKELLKIVKNVHTGFYLHHLIPVVVHDFTTSFNSEILLFVLESQFISLPDTLISCHSAQLTLTLSLPKNYDNKIITKIQNKHVNLSSHPKHK